MSTELCLACSSSLLPSSSKSIVFTTNCCQRPICPTCLASNPRLKRYDPCLACLGGVDVVSRTVEKRNADGGIRDEDVFSIGDDEDEDEDEDASPPPPYQADDETAAMEGSRSDDRDQDTEIARDVPQKYYIRNGDTLQGICLRFGVDGWEVCKLNKLPVSTLTTTPRLLHTRGFVMLPAGAKMNVGDSVSREEEEEREAKRVRERAEKKLQMITKEVDWRVAKAYVALAKDEDREEKDEKGKGKGKSLEAAAVDRYLEDTEWEERALKRREMK